MASTCPSFYGAILQHTSSSVATNAAPVRKNNRFDCISYRVTSSSRCFRRFHLRAGADEFAEAAEPDSSTNAAVQENVEGGGSGAVDGDPDLIAKEKKTEAKERKVTPKGLTRYETMAVLRPDITEEQRSALSKRYEQEIISGGGVDVEIFNRGIMPLAYTIVNKNTRGEKKSYVDGIYYMFTYATKPLSMSALEKKMNLDDDIIRSMTVKVKRSVRF